MLTRKEIKKIVRNSKDFILGDIFKINTYPTFIIAGAQKSGTTSLAYYLSQHPEIQQAYEKEVGYFNSKRYYKGDNWYRKQFPPRFKKVKYFEATPDYMYIKSFPERVYKHNKDIKIILILRNPIDRAYSAWNMFKGIHAASEYRKNRIINRFIIHGDDEIAVENFIKFLNADEYPDFSSYIQMELNMIKERSPVSLPGFIRYGLYYEQIEPLFRYLDKKNILILENRELKLNKELTLEAILEFLEIAPSVNGKFNLEEVGTRSYSEPMSIEDRKLLADFYHIPNKKLFDLIGKEYAWK
ncbi:MAG: sulfotransferase domain-containing protein [Flavobacteriaceae bacterium]|nr:sulfotransferase domain-containing protein [Flavobacteriaceae bacterium]